MANILLAIQLGGVTCGATSENDKVGEDNEESETTTMVEPDSTDNSENESGATFEPKSKRVPSPPTPPSPSQKEKPPKGVKKKKVSSRRPIGENRRPKDFAECLEYFKQRRIPNPQRKAEQFFAHYESNGWKSGLTPLAKWGYALNKWIGNNPDWKPEEKEGEGKDKKNLEAVLKWMEKKHPEWYEKHKDAKTINEIDGYYLDEFRN